VDGHFQHIKWDIFIATKSVPDFLTVYKKKQTVNLKFGSFVDVAKENVVGNP
jgi:hypothetical protein